MSKFDKKEYNKQYREQKKEKIKEYMKQYRAENKQKIKQYYAENKEKLKEQGKQYRERNKEKVKEYENSRRESKKHNMLNRTYGITLEQYNNMHANQNGVCAICKQPETTKHQSGTLKSLALDHCHSTGKIRALLCKSCNTGIGSLKEDTKLLQAAIDYLKSYESEA